MSKKVVSAVFVLVFSAHLLAIVPAAHAHMHELETAHLQHLHE